MTMNNLPDQTLSIDSISDNHGVFIFEPLERGYGVTIGNALRRVLLTSLEGYAVTAIRISGVKHEFDTIEGVVESLVDIILNLKGVIFKKLNDSDEDKVLVKITNKNVFKAGDISNASSSFKVVNPDHVICHFDDSIYFEIELHIGKGKGYVPAEENKVESDQLGIIPIDSIYTPIINVSYEVGNTRVGRKTDYDRLIIDVKTNGSVKPDDAIKTAASIITSHFSVFSDSVIPWKVNNVKGQNVDSEISNIKKILNTPISELNMSVRSYNCLYSADIKNLADLVKLKDSDMMQFRNFGKKSLDELAKILEDRKLKFGMDLSKYGF